MSNAVHVYGGGQSVHTNTHTPITLWKQSDTSRQEWPKSDGALFQLLPRRPHRRDLLRGERLEGLGDEVRVGADHLLPPGSLHDVRDVVRVDEVYCGRLE